MKRLVISTLFSFALLSAYSVSNAAVSVQIGEPGFYGRIDIGGVPQPQIIYREPIIVRSPRTQVIEQPLYLRVPPGHEKHWSKHCSKYNACGRPVYFVRNDWYNNVYAPHYRDHHRRDEHRDDYRDDRRDDGDDHGHRQGKGHGHGHKHN